MENLIPDDLIVDSNELQFEKQIGIGGYAEVWQGTWRGKGAGLTVAIKKVPLTGITASSQRGIMSEVYILSKLRHPLLLQIFGACFVQKELWIITEFIDGGSLFELLHSEVELSWEIRLHLAHQAAASVHVLHSSGILHRDIKSLNFLVSTDCRTLKLIDFGISKHTAIVSSVPREAIGTLRWCAPEILCENPQWSTGSDIYSLGVTFCEIASRKIPFENVIDSVVIQLIVEQNHPHLPVDCPQWFESIITACWNNNILKRPTSQQLTDILEILINEDKLEEIQISFEEKEFSLKNTSCFIPGLHLSILQWLPNCTFSLLYKATRDGFKAQDFHKLCDNKGPTLTVIRSSDGYLFGGYSPLSWESTNNFKSSTDAFIFTLHNPHNIPPTKYTVRHANTAIYCGADRGPCFGGAHDIRVSDDANQKDANYTGFPYSYNNTTGKGRETFTGTYNYTASEVDVFVVKIK